MKKYMVWYCIPFLLILSLIIDKITPAHVNFIPAILIGTIMSFVLFLLGFVYFLLDKRHKYLSKNMNFIILLFSIYTVALPFLFLIIALK